MSVALLPPGTEDVLRRALAEDLGDAGDITTNSIVPATAEITADVVARRAGRIAGLGASLRTFSLIDGSVVAEQRIPDGSDVATGNVVAVVSGPARPILSGERVALNLLGHLSGIATATRDLCTEIADTAAVVADTRKTAPGLRSLEKLAVRLGGGVNHRFGLYDAVLIKDNHLAAAGSIQAAVTAARDAVGHVVTIEVEVDTLEQLDEALAVGVDAVLLDNMDPSQLSLAVTQIAGRCISEASGGITSETIRAVAESGVDVISVGWITHSAAALDVGLDVR